MHPLYGKKKKKLAKCANPLFVKWLREWRDEAAEKGAKSQYTYGKALKTLLKFPLEMKSGKDCKILENFGDKICKLLDDKLATHIATYGSATPVDDDDEDDEYNLIAEDKSKGKRKDETTKNKSRGITAGPSRSVPPQSAKIHQRLDVVDPVVAGSPVRPRAALHEISDSDNELEPVQPARKRQRSGRENGEKDYVPAYRSGPYAILLTLYRDMQKEDARGFMTKTELVRDAQKLADKSFTFPDPSCRYTAWSSMGTLIKKGLVIKESNPAKYSLTDAGCELAHRLETVETDVMANAAEVQPAREPVLPIPAANAPVAAPPRLPSMDIDDQTTDVYSYGVTGRLRYWYVQDNGEETIQKDKAMVTVDDNIGIGFLVKCNYRELLKAGLRYKLDTDRPVGDDLVYAYLGNEDTEEYASPPPIYPEKKKPKKNPKKPRETNSCKNVEDDISDLSPLSPETTSDIMLTISSPIKQDNIVIKTAKTLSTSLSTMTYSDKGLSGISSQNSDVCGQSLMDRLNSKFKPTTVSYTKTDSQSSIDSSQNSVKSITSVSTVSSLRSLPEPDYVLRPPQFDIVLCVDNAEFYGASKGTSKSLLPDLIKNGVDCNLRKLHVGDLLWIAKEKMMPVPGQLEQPQGRELVLNYIIERKRMDDLVSSCMDGRFKEQKFRLKKCGLQNPMYLIEDYGSMQHFSIPEATIKQAITNTQVIDGFQVKRTKDSKETVAFLTILTRYLQSSFKDKILFACSLDKLRELDQKTSVNDTEQYLPTFEEFNQSSVKSKALSVQEMFGKQLIQLYGMSAEKARAVIEAYPTPTQLMNAFDRCTDVRSREQLLSSIKCGKSVRSLGLAQSKQISQLYNTHEALS